MANYTPSLAQHIQATNVAPTGKRSLFMQVISITDLKFLVNPTQLTIPIDTDQQDFQLINTISNLVDSLDALRTWHGFLIAAALG